MLKGERNEVAMEIESNKRNKVKEIKREVEGDKKRKRGRQRKRKGKREREHGGRYSAKEKELLAMILKEAENEVTKER